MIVVTGGSGYIGTEVVARLQQTQEVAVADLMCHPNVDVMKAEQLEDTLRVWTPSTVCHLAGPVLGTARKDLPAAMRLQLEGTRNVLDSIIRLHRPCKIVLASTFYVYDGISPDLAVSESTALDLFAPEPFGGLKLMAEELVKLYHKAYQIQYVILRFGSAYGAQGQAPGTNAVADFVRTVKEGHDLEVWGHGFRRNQYTSVWDLADGVGLAIQHGVNETYNLISPEETTTGQMAEAVARLFGRKVTYRPEKPESAMFPYMVSRKAIRELGWMPMPFEDGLQMVAETKVAVPTPDA